jgi:hemolysin D
MTGQVQKMGPTQSGSMAPAERSVGGPGEMVAVRPTMLRADQEFLPAALEIIETPPSPVRIALLWFTCLAFLTVLAWSYFGHIDIHAVAPGRLQPSGRSKTVQPMEVGRVVTINVENGKKIKAGDVLVELDPTESGADRDAIEFEVQALRAEIARRELAIKLASQDELKLQPIKFPSGLSAEVKARETFVLEAEIGQLIATQDGVRSQLAEREASKQRLTMSITARERLVKVLQERVSMRDTLNQKQIGSRATVIDALQELEKESTVIAGERGQLLEALANVQSLIKKQREQAVSFIAEQSQKLAEAERKRDRGSQDLVKAKTRNERTQMRASVDGTVQQLALTTVGQVVSPGQTLMTIVPSDGNMEVEVMILNQDIGFVEVGQRAVVKIDAFPFTRYGTIDATVLQVSSEGIDQADAAALSDPAGAARSSNGQSQQRGQNLVFPAIVRLDRRSMNVDGKDVALSYGMMVNVEIKTGARRVIDYVLSPLREVTSTAGHGR